LTSSTFRMTAFIILSFDRLTRLTLHPLCFVFQGKPKLTPDQQLKLAAMRREAKVDQEMGRPPAPPTPPKGVRCCFSFSRFEPCFLTFLPLTPQAPSFTSRPSAPQAPSPSALSPSLLSPNNPSSRSLHPSHFSLQACTSGAALAAARASSWTSFTTQWPAPFRCSTTGGCTSMLRC
jgi:hypothetical protein